MENLKEEIEIEEENYPIAFVKFDFLARKERETNLRVGEKVLIYWKNDNSLLWNGKNLNTNRVGWFPSNHVQIVTDESYRVLNQEVVTYEVAEAFAEFQTSKERRMSLKVGDKIAVCTQSLSGWWNGKNLRTNQIGWFPANHVKLTHERVITDIPIGETLTQRQDEDSQRDFERDLKEWLKAQREEGNVVKAEDLRKKVSEFSFQWLDVFLKRQPQIVQPVIVSPIVISPTEQEDIDTYFEEEEEIASDIVPLKQQQQVVVSTGTKKNESPTIKRVFSPTFLSLHAEESIVQWIDDSFKKGQKLNPLQIRQKATEIAQMKDPSRAILSKCWFKAFKQRHPEIGSKICVRTVKQKSLEEAEESELAEWVRARNATGSLPSRKEVILKGTEIAKRIDSSRCVSASWVIKFQHRHPELQIQVTQKTKFFSEEDEREIVDWVQKQNDVGKYPTGMDVRRFAAQLSEKKEMSKNSFGNDWLVNFRSRHPGLMLRDLKRKRDELDKQQDIFPVQM